MSELLDYDFSKVTLKKNVYSPEAHGDLESDQYLLRKYVVEILDGKRAIEHRRRGASWVQVAGSSMARASRVDCRDVVAALGGPGFSQGLGEVVAAQ